MGRKRKYSSFYDEADADDRSLRRWRRNIIRYRYFNHDAGDKNSSSKGKSFKTSEKAHGSDEVFIDSDYAKYLLSLSTENVNDSKFTNNRSVHSGDLGADTLVHDALIINVENDSEADESYQKYLNRSAGVPAGNSNFSKHRSEGNGDSRGDTVVENTSTSDDDSDINCEKILKGESVDDDYQNHLDSLAFDDDHSDDYMGRDLDSDDVNGFVKDGDSEEELVDNRFQNSDAAVGDDNNNVFSNVDPQFKNISGGHNMDNDKQNADYMEHADGNPPGHSKDSAFGDDWSKNHVSVEFNAANQYMKNVTCGNWSEENSPIDVDDGSFKVSSAKTGTLHNDALDNPPRQSSDCAVWNDWSVDHVSVEFNDVNQYTENGICGNWFEGNDAIDVDGESFRTPSANNGTLVLPLGDGTVPPIIKHEPHDSCRVGSHDEMKSDQEAFCKSKPKCDDLMDESYRFFLNSVKLEGDRLIFFTETGAKVVYNENEDEESSSDSEVMILDTDPFADENYTPFVPQSVFVRSDDEDDDCIMGFSRNNSWFREKVTECLRKPYDEKEYKRLFHDLTVKKPIEVPGGELRSGGTRRRISRELGKSYYDSEQGLKSKITAAGSNRYKVLNLMRGFFCWLQYMVHDGVFKPWEDKECLKLLPQVVRT